MEKCGNCKWFDGIRENIPSILYPGKLYSIGVCRDEYSDKYGMVVSSDSSNWRCNFESIEKKK